MNNVTVDKLKRSPNVIYMSQETVGERIKRLREAKGLSQDELAKLANMTGGYLGRLERGEDRYSNPTLSSISAIADALGVEPSLISYGSTMAPNTFFGGTHIDPNNPLDVTALVKKVEPLLPLSKDEKELLSNYREINSPKKKKQFLDLSKMFSGS